MATDAEKQQQQGNSTAIEVKLGVKTFVEPLDQCGDNQNPVHAAVALVTLAIVTSWFFILIGLFLSAFYSRIMLAVFVALVFTVRLPAKVFWTEFLNSFLFKYWREYFSLSFVLEEHLDTKKHFVLAEFPHGVFPWSQVVAASITDKLFPGMKIFAISSSTMFVIPFYKHFMSWIGCEPATKKNFVNLLKRGPTAVVVGGLAEMYTCFEKKEYMLGYRKGYVKVAVETGNPVVPIYHFGVSQTMSAFGGRESIINLEKISRKTFFSFLIPYGRFFLPIPRKFPLMIVVGKSIPVKQLAASDPGFHEEVDRVHALVNSELGRIYKQYRSVYNEEWKDRPLEIELGKNEVQIIS